MGFNERKVAQMAAFFLGQSNGKMPHLKLMALLYLSDREAMRAFGWTISGDSLISISRGPVLLQALKLMNGDAKSQSGEWEKWISDDGNDVLSLCQNIDAGDALRELSQADIETLKAVWDKFGTMDKWAICYWTRKNCAEWKNPNGGPYRPIQYDALARAVGFDDASAKEVAAQIQSEQEIDRLFRGLR
ncbi:Panacea domain-containing protein [Ferrovum sp.]|jgi:hypothetical protein|uniref:Panacea domain-containing protein n=1 Tax=Ferrovum sp. TaxID=2609467 RepID=UPI00262B30FC|nr:Panacea domain-containing protein [Ferrovum sp.]